VTRSIHETRRELEEARRWDFGNRRRHEEAVWLVQDRLSRKRRYKQRAARSRASREPPGHPAPLEIVTEPTPPHAHHLLSEEDVRRLLDRFPGDVRPLIERVHRRVGILEDDMRADEATPDPLTGRHGFEQPGGMWMPALRGRVRFDPFEIDLFAYVYDESALRVPQVQTTILWLEQAYTLAHEVAHAWDRSARSARDRWALDETVRAEEYAEAAAREWARTLAACFADAHPLHARAFGDWVDSHIGIPISLARVAEDLDRSFWGVDKGLLEVCARWGEIDQLDARVEVAEQFHFVEDFEPAREILATVLARDPDHVQATILMGDIAVHEQSWADALRWTEKAILLAPTEVDAHEDRVDALMGAREWAAAASAADAALELVPDPGNADHSRLRLERARCLTELGDFERAGADLDQVIAQGRPPHSNAGRALRAEWLVRQHRWAEARDEAAFGLRGQLYLWQKAFLTAALWEASRNLGVRSPTPAPTINQVELLRWIGRDQWVDRLIGMGLEPAADRSTRRQAELSRRFRGPLSRL
jgi:tetratricopeptide (TPR) repeat protein